MGCTEGAVRSVARAIANTWKAFTRTLCVGVVPFLLSFAYPDTSKAAAIEQADNDTSYSETAIPRTWLDPAPRRTGLMLCADASVVANYIWRGLYVGGLGIQASARANYEGLFADMWWNIGTTDWAFTGFNPEVDITVGFDRWGVQLYWLHAVYFDGTHFFNFRNAAPGQAGNTDELRFRYRVSNRLPLSFLWCTRLVGRDGYPTAGDNTLRRAYSSYFEFKYEFALPYDMALHTTVGMTPWRSLYTDFEGDFAVVNIDVTFLKVWQLRSCAISLTGDLMFNPWRVNKDNIRWTPSHPSAQRLNANISVGVSWNRQFLPHTPLITD